MTTSSRTFDAATPRPVHRREVSASEAPRARVAKRSLLRDEGGAAYAEAVVMMPVFIAMLALFGLVHHEAHQKMSTMAESRSQAWQTSNAGCNGEAVGCDSCTTVGSDEDGTVFGSIQDAFGDIGSIPIVGSILQGMLDGLLGTQTTLRASASVNRPNYLGGGARDASSSYTVMCNPVRQSIWGMVRDAFCGFIPFLC